MLFNCFGYSEKQELGKKSDKNSQGELTEFKHHVERLTQVHSKVTAYLLLILASICHLKQQRLH